MKLNGLDSNEWPLEKPLFRKFLLKMNGLKCWIWPASNSHTVLSDNIRPSVAVWPIPNSSQKNAVWYCWFWRKSRSKMMKFSEVGKIEFLERYEFYFVLQTLFRKSMFKRLSRIFSDYKRYSRFCNRFLGDEIVLVISSYCSNHSRLKFLKFFPQGDVRDYI